MCACSMSGILASLGSATERIIHHRTDRLAFDNAFHDTARARLGLDHTATGRRAFLHIARLRFHRLGLCLDRDRLVSGVICDRRFSDMHCTTCQHSTTRGSRGQFRQGHFYRHGQTLLLLPGHG